jgi:hypothetical protein
MSQLALGLTGFGSLRADLAAIPALRKSVPSWAPSDTPSHFLKHADEQTVLAVAAVDRMVQTLGGDAAALQNWPIIAAPQFIGRLGGTTMLVRYARSGSPSISPHLIPQHSLHSISGALSILLGSHQPNFGIGGAAGSFAEGLLAALTCPVANVPGVIFVATAFDPEPQIDQAGQCTNSPTAYALALALQPAAGSSHYGHVRLETQAAERNEDGELAIPLVRPTLPQVIAEFNRLLVADGNSTFRWQLTSGMTIALHIVHAAVRLAAAA